MQVARSFFSLTLLDDGVVLAVGGATSAESAEVYDPVRNTWTIVPGGLRAPRLFHTATRLPDGRVVIAGGSGAQSLVEIYEPSTGRFVGAGLMLAPRSLHTATVLPDDPQTPEAEIRIVIAGGVADLVNTTAPRLEIEVYDAVRGTSVPAGVLSTGRAGSYASLVPSRRVLVAGGDASSWLSHHAAEIVDIR